MVRVACVCRYYVLRNNVVEKVLKLLNRREKWLVVAAVRFLRTCIGLKDDFYNRYLVCAPVCSCPYGRLVSGFKGPNFEMWAHMDCQWIGAVKTTPAACLILHM